MKVFKLCDNMGYTYNFEIYVGKESQESGSGLGIAHDVVVTLAKCYFDEGKTVVTDNFYTSIPLAHTLLARRTHLVGTVRVNRKGLPDDIRHAKLKKGEALARHSQDGIVIMQWHDKMDVVVLTTRHTDAIAATGKKRQAE